MRSRHAVAILSILAMMLALTPAGAIGLVDPELGTTTGPSLPPPEGVLDDAGDGLLAGGRTPTVDDTLLDQLEGDGSAAAVVTTWDADGIEAIRGLGISGSELRALPMLLVPDLTLDQLGVLGAEPAVRSVWANETYELFMEDTTWIVNARDVWGEYRDDGFDQTGFTGDGVEIAVIDTGADGRHGDFGNLVEFCETRQALTEDRSTVLCSPFDETTGNAGPAGPTNDPRLDSVEDFHHGSHVAGTIAGTGASSGGIDALHSTIGIAPHAKLRSYSANVGPTLANHEILASYDDLIWKKQNGFNDVVAVNNSWGGGAGFDYDPDDPVQVAVNTAFDAGILSVFAAGNSGPEHDTLSRQCVNPNVVCVGATTKSDAIVGFSSRGRPSGPTDTNRDGVVDENDVAPGNHDRTLGQQLSLGVYRPTLVGPGVNINAMDLGAVGCYEEVPEDERTGCYVALNGTSMATPHVAGATAVIAEAYASATGALPDPGILTDILERSAVTLPGYGAEEQGAGRLDLARAVEMARNYPDGPALTLGTPAPVFAEGLHPGADDTITLQRGCTGTLSWSTSVDDPFFDPPPEETARFGQHVIDVPDGAERLRVTVDWHDVANLYLRLWRPDVDPDAESAPAGPDRVFPDNESVGLIAEDEMLDGSRWFDVRAPEPGEWILRVYHRAGGTPEICDPDSDEVPKQIEGFNYDVKVETPIAADLPSVAITDATVSSDERFVDLSGTADHPVPWDGVVNWEVPGSRLPSDTVRLHFRRDLGEHDPGRDDVDDTGCTTGEGSVDVTDPDCDGPFLVPDGELPGGTPATFATSTVVSGSADRTPWSPNWTWWLDEPTSIGGPMTLEWWASCTLCSPVLADDWVIRVWADGEEAFEERIRAAVGVPIEPGRIRTTVEVNNITAEDRFTVTVDPVFLNQAEMTFLYDSADPCPGALTDGSCDGFVEMPIVDASLPEMPTNVRVADLHRPDDALRITWDAVQGASGYEIHRSDEPGFVPDSSTVVGTTSGESCASPDVPSWPSASRDGLCWTDAGVSLDTTHYYRIVAITDAGPGEPSLLASGAPTSPDRQVKLKVDRLFGPGYWEYATLTAGDGTAWTYTWDRLGLDTQLGLDVAARSFTQGIGSVAVTDIVDPEAPADGLVRGSGQVPGEAGELEESAATFTLRARGGETPTMTFTYRDPEADVRIEAVDVDTIQIASTTGGGACEITGTAEVTRDGATSTESFTLSCEDNGTPGRDTDMLQVTTDTYKGGGTLIAGRVRIDVDD